MKLSVELDLIDFLPASFCQLLDRGKFVHVDPHHSGARGPGVLADFPRQHRARADDETSPQVGVTRAAGHQEGG